MLIAVLSGFVLALFAPWVHRVTKGFTGWLMSLLPMGLFVYFALFLGQVAEGDVIREVTPWVPIYGINLSFVLDGLSLLMVLIVTGIGALIFIYSNGYLKGDKNEGKFYSFLLIFMAAMVGLVLSDNLLTLFVFWELTSISSYLLIGFKHDYADSRTAALNALLVTGIGGLAMLAGFILLGNVGGTLEISELVLRSQDIRGSDLYLPLLILISAGAFTKSAQFPFHFWLPGAMAAPTPVSAYLHSATMVKAGVFLLARLSPVLSDTLEWRVLLTAAGVITMLAGAYLSIKQSDLKRILAYSTVSSLGMLVALIGWDTKIAAEAAMLFLLSHSLYKGALFMTAGAIDFETGTRDINQLGGLLRVMPFIAIGTMLAVLSMSGIPPLIGFISKELTYEATLSYEAGAALAPDMPAILLTLVALLTNIATITVGCMVFFKPFMGLQKETPRRPKRAPISLWLGPVVLGVIALMFGLLTELPLPDIAGDYLIAPAASKVYGNLIDLNLHLIPSAITPMLILSIITVVSGVVGYIWLGRLLPLLDRLDQGTRAGPARLFQMVVDKLPGFSRRVTLLFQSGYLRSYVAWIVGTMVVLVAYTLFTRVTLPGRIDFGDVRVYELILAAVILMAVVMVVRSTSLLVAITSMGVIGFAIALLFILYGAPDLAMTQFAIETLSVVLFVLVLYRLPDLAGLSSRASRLRDALIAIAAGLLVTTLVIIITARPLFSPLAKYFTEASYPEAQGRNVVNVILVDFRGMDTMGEITVLAVAAMGVFALLKLRVSDLLVEDDVETYEEMISVEEESLLQGEQES